MLWAWAECQAFCSTLVRRELPDWLHSLPLAESGPMLVCGSSHWLRASGHPEARKKALASVWKKTFPGVAPKARPVGCSQEGRYGWEPVNCQGQGAECWVP